MEDVTSALRVLTPNKVIQSVSVVTSVNPLELPGCDLRVKWELAVYLSGVTGYRCQI